MGRRCFACAVAKEGVKTKSHLSVDKCDILANITRPTQLQDGTTYDSDTIIHNICMESMNILCTYLSAMCRDSEASFSELGEFSVVG